MIVGQEVFNRKFLVRAKLVIPAMNHPANWIHLISMQREKRTMQCFVRNQLEPADFANLLDEGCLGSSRADRLLSAAALTDVVPMRRQCTFQREWLGQAKVLSGVDLLRRARPQPCLTIQTGMHGIGSLAGPLSPTVLLPWSNPRCFHAHWSHMSGLVHAVVASKEVRATSCRSVTHHHKSAATHERGLIHRSQIPKLPDGDLVETLLLGVA